MNIKKKRKTDIYTVAYIAQLTNKLTWLDSE